MFIIRSHLSQTIISGIHLSFQGWGSWKLYNGQRFQGHSKTSNLRPFKMIVNSWVYNILVLKNMLFLWLPNGHGSLIMISSIQRWTTHESVCPAWNYIYIYMNPMTCKCTKRSRNTPALWCQLWQKCPCQQRWSYPWTSSARQLGKLWKCLTVLIWKLGDAVQ